MNLIVVYCGLFFISKVCLFFPTLQRSLLIVSQLWILLCTDTKGITVV